jgi:hypothetical protein
MNKNLEFIGRTFTFGIGIGSPEGHFRAGGTVLIPLFRNKK